jgi:hypothetical protein
MPMGLSYGTHVYVYIESFPALARRRSERLEFDLSVSFDPATARVERRLAFLALPGATGYDKNYSDTFVYQLFCICKHGPVYSVPADLLF